jgi:hypothetical protein
MGKDGGPGQAGVGDREALEAHRERVAQCDQPVLGRHAPGCDRPNARNSDTKIRLIRKQRLRCLPPNL